MANERDRERQIGREKEREREDERESRWCGIRSSTLNAMYIKLAWFSIQICSGDRLSRGQLRSQPRQVRENGGNVVCCEC